MFNGVEHPLVTANYKKPSTMYYDSGYAKYAIYHAMYAMLCLCPTQTHLLQ